MIKLGFNLKFDDLYSVFGLEQLDKIFLNYLEDIDPSLATTLEALKTNAPKLDEIYYSNFLINTSPHLENFLIELFSIQGIARNNVKAYRDFDLIYQCKRQFVQRIALKKYSKDEAKNFDITRLLQKLTSLLSGDLSDFNFANAVTVWQKDKEIEKLEIAERYAAYQVYYAAHKTLLFTVPHKIDFNNLLKAETSQEQGFTNYKAFKGDLHTRKGFRYSGEEVTLSDALNEAHYCIYCHKQNKDSCSKGLKENPPVATATFKKSEGDVSLTGCPLEQKISEMNLLKAQGFNIAALAVITIDNPMLIATGHRICNDCMKSCIYQKQEPVNIPKIETRILNDVLDLPYGFEIYSLLTRWNPLKYWDTRPKSDTNYKILIAGLGPAGFTLAHYLLNEGHSVYAIDGLKIEPLDPGLVTPGSFRPIIYVKALFEDLDKRKAYGFGGVAEYGITVRFNKNYLTLARILLERHQNFFMHGGIRLGSNITIKQAFEIGFDHIALCLGAGKPNIPNISNILAKGVRTASDFLMSLQLSGAFRSSSIANLTVRMPICVIGGGLTAVDAASEVLNYYPVQVEKFLSKYEILVTRLGQARVEIDWNEEDKIIASEFIQHAKLIRQEQINAQQEGRKPNIIRLLNEWGGAVIYYRKSLQESPAYRLNHEEIDYALKEGIKISVNASPYEIKTDKYGYAEKIIFKTPDSEAHEVLAKTIIIAVGTLPNLKLAEEEGDFLKLNQGYFKFEDVETNRLNEASPKKFSSANFITYSSEQGSISYFGDLHKTFAGNVVRAMASAKNGYPHISRTMLKYPPKAINSDFKIKVESALEAYIHQINRLAPNIIELIIKAPLCALNFKPGQFYRLQNYESNAKILSLQGIETVLAMEGLALTGAWVDKEAGLISTIVLEMGASSKLCADFKIGEKVTLMGPTGAPTELKAKQIVLLAGGGLGNAVLFSIGKALRALGSKVIYFAAYRKAQDRFKIEEIHAASDIVVWCCEEEVLEKFRDFDASFKGNILQAMQEYNKSENIITLGQVDEIIAIGSNRMMEAIARARYDLLRNSLKPEHKATASINSPMQCMMKEICAQCLQKQIDPTSGKEYYVFTCSNQDQDMDKVSFAHLKERLEQNSLQEKLTNLWVEQIKAQKSS
jgi:NADPH-dependent glutamate synthase beta subunit-like oxidoreductase/NAD(P)H-flavin reductase